MEAKIEFNEQFKFTIDLLENSSKNVFLTGKAGTGKSTLLKCFCNTTNKNIVVLAPTGVSAVNIGGQTIHSFFRFKPDITVDGVHLIRIPQSRKKLYKNIDALVIDEISMVRSDLLDCINEFLQLFGKSPQLPFGGVQIIFVGDLYQLPPVVTRLQQDIFENIYRSPYFFDARSFEFLALEYVELKKLYRQREEKFIEILNAVRNKVVKPQHLKMLNARVMKNFQPTKEDLYIYLTTTNDLSNRINNDRLKQINEELYNFQGEVSGDFAIKNLPTMFSLDLKLGAQVMLLMNDPMGRWINGSIGKIISIRSNDSQGETDNIQVELVTGKVVNIKPFTWEMFRFFYNEDTEKVESEIVGSFTQYPLRLAWALTIHKSQGKTFSNVILDIGTGTFAHGQLYVALSRCTTLGGLVLKQPIFLKDIRLDRRVVDFSNQALKESCC